MLGVVSLRLPLDSDSRGMFLLKSFVLGVIHSLRYWVLVGSVESVA